MLEWLGLIPLLGLTGNWRGYRMGGKAIGGANMSTDMKKKFEAARAAGNMEQAKALADKAQSVTDAKKEKTGRGVEPTMKMNPETGEMTLDYTGMSKAQIKTFEAKLAKESAKAQKELDEIGFGETRKMNEMTLPESLKYASEQLKKISPEAINDLDRRTAKAMGQYIDSQNRLIDVLLDETGTPLVRPQLTAPAAKNLKALSGDAPKPSKPISQMGFLEASAETAKKLNEFQQRRQASQAGLNKAFTDAVRAGDAVVQTILDESKALPGSKKQPKAKQIKGGE